MMKDKLIEKILSGEESEAVKAIQELPLIALRKKGKFCNLKDLYYISFNILLKIRLKYFSSYLSSEEINTLIYVHNYNRDHPHLQEAVNIIINVLRAQSSSNKENIIYKSAKAALSAINKESKKEYISAINLSGMDLSNIDLSGVDLSGAYFKKTILAGADIQGANLQYTYLYAANLQGVNLKNANLEEADLTKANLKNADLQGINLCQSQLAEANLQKSNLKGADLTAVNLYNAQLQGANLEGADLQSALLRIANLTDANLQKAILQGVDLKRAYLKRTNLKNANLQGADLYQAKLYGADLVETNLQKADLTEADLTEANLYRADLQNADLEWSDLDLLIIDKPSYDKYLTHYTNYRYVSMNECNTNKEIEIKEDIYKRRPYIKSIEDIGFLIEVDSEEEESNQD